MKQLTDDQWRYYEQRYGKLMKMISSRISGDEALANPEDNYSDLCIAALESIDVAMNNKLFDQYTKTVLWNRKAKKGIPLTNKMPFRNKHFSIDQMKTSGGEHNSFDLEDPKASLDLSSMFLEETFGHANPDVKVIVNAIVKDPSVVTEEGKLKNASLRNTTGLSLYRISKAVNSIKMLSNNDKEYDA